VLDVLEDVKSRLQVLTPGPEGWTRAPLLGAPDFGTVSVSALDDEVSDDYFLTVTDYLTPTSLQLGRIGETPQTLKRLPAFFDASGLAISQHFATSKDGTRIPYFQVAARDLAPTG
jgi:prolyl oligopeptidase